MDLLKKFDELNNRLSNLLEENKELKRQNKNFQEENHVLKEKLNERDYENLQEENKKLKQHALDLENQKNDQLQKYKNLQEENKRLNERENQFQQHIQTLENQKSEQFEIFSQNLEKALGKLRLDELDEDNVNNPQKDLNILRLDELDEENVNNPKNDLSLDYLKDPTAKEATKKRSQKVTIKKEPIPPIDKSSFNKDNIRVVVGLDFGTTYSGFSYCHTADSENIITNDQWPGEIGNLKTNTVLRYDNSYINVESWGYPALVKRPSRRMNNRNETRPIELFKLHLGNLSDDLKPQLPIDFKKAITDYLHEIGKTIKEKIASTWSRINFLQHVLLVITIPTEYSEKDKAIMRECVFNAGLLENEYSANLQFTTESEAAAIYCIQNVLKEHDLPTTESTTFMVVDCSGGTIDITTRKLIGNNHLGEVTESIDDFCGSTFIDDEFIKFLRKKLGDSAINSFRDNYYGQFQYMVQEFRRNAKILFTGDPSEYRFYELDIQDSAPNLLQYVNEETRHITEENEWLIEIDYEDIKAMFDPVVDRIIKLINLQLSYAREKCSAMFLVGGFSESKYLQQRIKWKFQNQINVISVPNQPMAAISCGATLYGLSLFNSENDNMKVTKCIITARILKYTFGIKVRNYWMKGDPIERKLRNGSIDRFHCIAKRGIQVDTNEVFTTFFTPLSPMQTRVRFKIYYTTKDDAKYCDEPGMTLLGTFNVELTESGLLDKLFFTFTFGEMEIIFTARNETNGRSYKTKFEIDI